MENNDFVGGSTMMNLEVFLWSYQSQGSGGRILDPVTKKWRKASELGQPSPRRDSAVVWTGEEVVVWGGRDASGTVIFKDGARYNPKTDTWRKITAMNAPEGRYSPATVWTGSRIYIPSGYVTHISTGYVPSMGGEETQGGAPAMYDPKSDVWHNLPDAPIGGNPSVFWTGDTGDLRTANKIITYSCHASPVFGISIYDFQTGT